MNWSTVLWKLASSASTHNPHRRAREEFGIQGGADLPCVVPPWFEWSERISCWPPANLHAQVRLWLPLRCACLDSCRDDTSWDRFLGLSRQFDSNKFRFGLRISTFDFQMRELSARRKEADDQAVPSFRVGAISGIDGASAALLQRCTMLARLGTPSLRKMLCT